MTVRVLPSLSAINAPTAVEYETPSTVYSKWNAVKAKNDNQPNTINMYDYIGSDWMGNGITAKMVSSVLRNADGDAVTVNINSPGGDMFEGVTIYNLLREYDGEVTVKVVGVAASAASVIAMSADELKIAQSGFLMIHNAWGIVIGNQFDFQHASNTFAKFDDAMAGLYSKRSGIGVNEIHDLMKVETWFTGDEAITKGFADSLLDSDQIEDDKNRKESAKHSIDKMLAQNGIPRSQRRRLYDELSSTHNAANNTTHNAGNIETIASSLGDLQSKLENYRI